VWYPDRSKATEKDPPLYLHIAATTPEVLQDAIDKVNELMAIDLGPLVEDKKDRLKVSFQYRFRLQQVTSFLSRENGPRKNFLSVWSRSGTSTFAPKSSDHL
jgi:hypothetical protein